MWMSHRRFQFSLSVLSLNPIHLQEDLQALATKLNPSIGFYDPRTYMRQQAGLVLDVLLSIAIAMHA